MKKSNKKRTSYTAKKARKPIRRARSAVKRVPNIKKANNAGRSNASLSKPVKKTANIPKKEFKPIVSRTKGVLERAQKELNSKRSRAKMTNLPDKDEVKAVIEELLANEEASNYLKKNVSRRTMEVISMLETPKTDEFIAEQLDTKVNTVRRVLNIMQGYGLTNYYISKNSNGWLSFAWYINVNKVGQFFNYIKEINANKIVINSECNDYFICENCYDKYKLLFVFDSAFEQGFKCSCGNKLTRLDREAASALIAKTNAADALERAEANKKEMQELELTEGKK
jgi:transcription initiation factor TFIIE subunit alpha